MVLPPEAAYYRPVVVDDMTYPVARATWLSVIEFGDDWHAPRMRLVGGRWRQVGVHQGHDITAEPGTPVVAMRAGVVEQMGWTFYSGNRVGVRGSDGRYYFYAHLSAYARGVGVGDAVSAGDLLGAVGNTGYGPPGHEDEFPAHLHLGVELPSGEWVNPLPLARRLYRRSVRHTQREEGRLAEILAEGDRAEARRLAASLYAGISFYQEALIPPPGQ